MKKRLVEFDVLEHIQNHSLNKTHKELQEAETLLAKTLGKSPLKIHCFTESKVVYQTPDNNYIHANYQIKDGHITFSNIEELIVDDVSVSKKRHQVISEMIDSLLENNQSGAEEQFSKYMSLLRWPKKPAIQNNKINEAVVEVNKRQMVLEHASALGMEDMYQTALNVLDYVDYMRNGPALTECAVRRDNKGNVVDVRVPTHETRTKVRLEAVNWIKPNAQNHEVRHSVPGLAKNRAFCEHVANLKRQNAFSDTYALEEALDEIVSRWPEVLLVTESELASILREALENIGVSNFDDQQCEFMAEGILRRAYETHQDKVRDLLTLAQAEPCQSGDCYKHFQHVMENYTARLDERFGLERKAFVDLYNALHKVYKEAKVHGSEAVKRGAATYLNELADILNGEIKPDLGAIQEAATWIKKLFENNVPGASNVWDVTQKPHVSVTGDHPMMGKMAKVPAVSGRHTGDWGEPVPAVDDEDGDYTKGAKKQKNSWSQVSGPDVFPRLKNPYVPQPFQYTLKGEPGVDKDKEGMGKWQSDSTWPNLKNPYVPQVDDVYRVQD